MQSEYINAAKLNYYNYSLTVVSTVGGLSMKLAS